MSGDHTVILTARATLTPARVDDLGIAEYADFGDIVYRHVAGILVAEIGSLVTASDVIHVVPRVGATRTDREFLLGAAERAFFTGPSVEDGWTCREHDGRRVWTTFLSIPVPADHPVARAIQSGRPGGWMPDLAA